MADDSTEDGRTKNGRKQVDVGAWIAVVLAAATFALLLPQRLDDLKSRRKWVMTWSVEPASHADFDRLGARSVVHFRMDNRCPTELTQCRWAFSCAQPPSPAAGSPSPTAGTQDSGPPDESPAPTPGTQVSGPPATGPTPVRVAVYHNSMKQLYYLTAEGSKIETEGLEDLRTLDSEQPDARWIKGLKPQRNEVAIVSFNLPRDDSVQGSVWFDREVGEGTIAVCGESKEHGLITRLDAPALDADESEAARRLCTHLLAAVVSLLVAMAYLLVRMKSWDA